MSAEKKSSSGNLSAHCVAKTSPSKSKWFKTPNQ